MREVLARPIPKVPALRGTSVTILFYEASTRTRVSFEVAAKNLSADVVNIAAAASSVAKGESLVDTVRTLEALGAQMLVMRHARVGRAVPRGRGVRRLGAQRRRRLARPPDAGAARPVHAARRGCPAARCEGRKVVILGDVLHSRVARSQHLDADRGWAPTSGSAARRRSCAGSRPGPAEARPAAAVHGRPPTSTAALRDADVVMALRIQQERMASGLLPSLREYAARYGLTGSGCAPPRRTSW